MIGSALGTSNRPQQLTSASDRFAAPYDGIDGRISLATGSPTHCIYTYNLIPHEFGMKVRNGYREWQTGLDEGSSEGVHTIIPFDSSSQATGANRLFAVTNEAIWDVTTPGDTPINKLAFGDISSTSGYGNYIHYTNQAGNDVMFYADANNGLFKYDANTDTWAQATGITGPEISKVRFIMIHKDRIWLVEKGANSAWYLPLDAEQGQAEEFFFGTKYNSGGSTAGLFSWSIDSGSGVNDFFVSVGRAGDVLVYRGSDPADASGADPWELVGTYFIGRVPEGPTFGSVNGGDLYLLSIYGLNSMGELLQGVNSAELFNSSETTSPSARIALIIQTRLSQNIDLFGWEVRRIPSENSLLISGPQIGSTAPIQYIYRLTTAAWGLWRNVPIESFENWQNNVVFGDADNRILYMDVTADNVLLNPSQAINGDAITFSILTNFRDLNAPTRFKRVKLIRPDFSAQAAPDVTIAARYDYDLTESFLTAASAPPPSDDSWDVATWDNAMWKSATGQNFSDIKGAWGIGRYVAIAMIGTCREETYFIGWDLIFDAGGPLL